VPFRTRIARHVEAARCRSAVLPTPYRSVVPADRFHLAAAVYGVLIEDDRVLLLRRAGSGYRDGQLSLPAGHLDGGEDAVGGLVRELREEVAIEADPLSCRLAVVLHRAAEWAGDDEYLDLVLTVGTWTGTPLDRRTGQVHRTGLGSARPPTGRPGRLHRRRPTRPTPQPTTRATRLANHRPPTHIRRLTTGQSAADPVAPLHG